MNDLPPDLNQSSPQSNIEIHDTAQPEGNWCKVFTSMFTKWRWGQDSNVIHLFLYLIVHANWEPSYFKGHRILRGQVATGLFSLASGTGLSIQSIRTALGKLKSTSDITIKSTNKLSIITIRDYDIYHRDENANQHALQQAGQQTNNKPTTTSREYKKIKKEKNKKDARHEALVVLFSEIKDQALLKAIKEWAVWRRNEKKKPVTALSVKKLLKNYANRTADLIRDLDYSIQQGWTGVFSKPAINGTVKPKDEKRHPEVVRREQATADFLSRKIN